MIGRWVAAAMLLGGSAAADGLNRSVPEDVQLRVEEAFAGRFVYPETSTWTFDFIEPYPGHAHVVCGRVDYQNAGRHYVGAKHFFALLNDEEVFTIAIDMDENEDRTGEGAFKMRTLCHLPG